MSKRTYFALGEGVRVRTDDRVIGSWNGVFGNRHEDTSVGKFETLGERII